MALSKRSKKPKKPTRTGFNPNPSPTVGAAPPGERAPRGTRTSGTVRPPVGQSPGTVDSITPPAPPSAAEPPPGAPDIPPITSAPPAPPPRLPGSQQSINEADQNYGITEKDVRNNLFQAALAYGDPELVKLYADYDPLSVDPTTPYGTPLKGPRVKVGDAPPVLPFGTLAQLQRDFDTSARRVGENRNRSGSFFSGLHQRDRDELSVNLGIQRNKALSDFKAAEAKLLGDLSRAFAARQAAYGGANVADFNAFMETPPEAQDEPTSPPAPGSPGGPPMPVGPSSESTSPLLPWLTPNQENKWKEAKNPTPKVNKKRSKKQRTEKGKKGKKGK